VLSAIDAPSRPLVAPLPESFDQVSDEPQFLLATAGHTRIPSAPRNTLGPRSRIEAGSDWLDLPNDFRHE